MEELEFILRQVVRNQPSLTQVVFTSEQFTALSQLASSVCEIAREKSEANAGLNKQVRALMAEKADLTKEAEGLARHMETWKAGLSESISVLRREVQSEAAISDRWLKELRREREKNDYLESVLRDYSGKVAALRAEANIQSQLSARLTKEKDMLAENFKRAENSLEGLLNKCRELRELNESQAVEFKRSKVNLEMELEAEKRNRSKESKHNMAENKDLLEKLKEMQDLAEKAREETNLLSDELDELKKNLEDKQIEVTKLSKDLEKAKENNKKLLEDNQNKTKEVKASSKAEKEIEQLTRENSSLADEVQKLKAQLGEQKKSAAIQNENKRSTNRSKETQNNESMEEVVQLKKKHSLLIGLLKQGTNQKAKDKTVLLQEIFENDSLKIPKTKFTYLELLNLATEKNKSKARDEVSEEPRDRKGHTRSMDIEKAPNLVKTMTPEKQANESYHMVPENDTAFKFQDCRHMAYQPDCVSCRVLHKGPTKTVAPISVKSKKGS